MGFRIGVDIGGTFTDLFGLDERSGEFMVLAKSPSTPSHPEQAVSTLWQPVVCRWKRSIPGRRDDDRHECPAPAQGARVLYLTTGGFEDVPYIQRINRK